ncbi:hypothetical protein AOXY_G7197 [Acipenser oxyrinchus oxyrinchus]|uniref:Uncharacterized protein n=1 Tax=Acipenser oxyrinchus oxyrinchus TaxID=40147 RepID=A0AAD8G9T7_ACIOX|nr:hypothetical protein AOXY_G7197 [Acipenser oxyrinchus oxyrinchus]
MTFVCLGVLVLAIYLPTQVDSVNNTTTPPSANQTNGMKNVTATLSPTASLSGSGNATTTKGTGNGLQSPLSSILVPLITSASILRLCC